MQKHLNYLDHLVQSMVPSAYWDNFDKAEAEYLSNYDRGD